MEACKFLILLAAIVGTFPAITQPLAQTSDTLEAKTDIDSAKYDFLYISQKAQNKFAFLGRDFGQNIPFTSTDVLYYFHYNLWISASQFFFMENEIPPQTGLAIGYYREVSSKADISVSYSQFLVSNDANITGLNSQGFFQGTIGLDWTYLYSTMQFQSLVTRSPDFFLTTQHSRYFEFNNLLWNKIKISFEPKASFTLGTDRFNYSDDDEDNGQAGGNGQGKGKGKGKKKPGTGGGDPDGEPEIVEESGDKIKPLNWEVLLPVSFELNRFTLELSSRYTYPLNVSYYDVSKPTFIFGAELTYYIPVKKRKSKL